MEENVRRMIMLLKELTIDRLYGKYDYDVKFNEDITFIYGMNGCGKTTILNITEAIITGCIFRLFEFQFVRIQLSYTDCSKGTIREISIKKHEEEIIVDFEGKTEKIVRLINPEREVISDSDYYDAARAYFSKYSLLKQIKLTFNHAYLPLNRSTRFDNEFDMMRLRRKYRYRFPSDEILYGQDNAMLKVEDLIDRKHSEILSLINKYNVEFRNEILKSLLSFKESNSLSEVLDAIGNRRIEDDEINRIKESYIKILQQLSILKDEEEKSYKDFFEDFLLNYNQWKDNSNEGLPTSLASKYTEIQRIKKLVKIAEKTEQRKDEAYKPIETYLKTINEFIYNEIDCKRLYINQNGEVYFTTGNNDNNIRITSLSSGEKQLVVFFASLVFEIQNDSTGIFIVDEPELSLHMSWQSIFVEKALSINKNVQLIFATHSPEIIGKYRDKMFKLEKKLSKKEMIKMSDLDELKYSYDAMLNRYYLCKGMYDISFFVEDTGKEYEYEEILERLLPNDKKRKIFPLNGKINLEKAFTIINDDTDKVFFIADGDFDLLLGRKRVEADNFIYLKRYNIESYLLYKPTITMYMRPRLKRVKSDTEQIVDYDKWEQSVIPFFKKVFAIHLIVQKNKVEMKNVSRGAKYFINEDGSPNEDNLNNYLNEVSMVFPDAKGLIPGQLAEFEDTYGEENGCFICGKYLIESLSRYLNTKPVIKKQNYDNLKSFLISNFDISQLDYVKEKIMSYM